jgi:hypothetical protein
MAELGYKIIDMGTIEGGEHDGQYLIRYRSQFQVTTEKEMELEAQKVTKAGVRIETAAIMEKRSTIQ